MSTGEGSKVQPAGAANGWSVVARPARPTLIVNPRSGDGVAARVGLVERARERGVEVALLEPARPLRELALDVVAGGADALGMAGGDGSLATVAAVAAARDLPFVCIPAGTRNHFARDIGLDPHDVVGALDAFVEGVERRIDLAEVNGRVFVNNVSLGVYGEAVRRQEYRDAKIRTLLQTVQAVVAPGGAPDVFDVVDDRGHQHRGSPLVVVSNGPYALEGPRARGHRPRLDAGVLGIIVVDAPARTPAPPARAWATDALEVGASASVVHAGIDGEPVELAVPVTFRTRPLALRVRVPARLAGTDPS